EFAEKDPKAAGIRFEALVPAAKIREVASAYKTRGYFLESLTAVDFTEGYELNYHFNRWGKADRSCIKVLVAKNPDESAAAPSLVGVYRAADWYEREAHEMFGIVFEGHPGLKRLLLPESSEIFPLRKSFKGEPKGSDVEQSLKLIKEDASGFELRTPSSLTRQGNDYYLNLGPQHPSTHGVLRVLLHLDGERVIGAEPVLGYSHRHHEKMMEIQNYLACWPNFGRLDYVGAMSYNFGYALLAEKAMGVTAPARAEHIRVVTTELNRIASHLLWMGTFLLDLGGFTPFFYCFDDRENILDILEMATGERLTYDYFRFGGVDHDTPEEFVPAIKKFLPKFKQRLRDYKGLVTDNVIFQHRTRGLGFLPKEKALEYGVTGPSLRAAGVAADLRRDEPYSLYPHLDFEIPTAKDGDVWSRYLVRTREMEESVKIVAQLLDKFPAGEYRVGKLPKNLPKGEYYSAVESARGSFGIYLVSDGGMNPYRIKLRTPSFSNLSAFHEMIRGALVSDVVAILGSTDIVLPEIDR
ncbi:MAG TPA: NADH-quinone oxidoreductase subunit C, partial [Candidatus Eisenbacteria bacterium]|nr:NADH-quinone oxidoreductase subunit C [Candidatus Eisenbacteria bacterium]